MIYYATEAEYEQALNDAFMSGNPIAIAQVQQYWAESQEGLSELAVIPEPPPQVWTPAYAEGVANRFNDVSNARVESGENKGTAVFVNPHTGELRTVDVSPPPLPVALSAIQVTAKGDVPYGDEVYQPPLENPTVYRAVPLVLPERKPDVVMAAFAPALIKAGASVLGDIIGGKSPIDAGGGLMKAFAPDQPMVMTQGASSGIAKSYRNGRPKVSKAQSYAENGRRLTNAEFAAKYGYYPRTGRKKKKSYPKRASSGGSVSTKELVKALIAAKG